MAIASWLLCIEISLKDIKDISKKYGVEWELITAIIMKESSGKCDVTRYEDHYVWLFKVKEHAQLNRITEQTEEILQKTSWGLMQVMGAVLREMGFNKNLPKAIDPKINVSYGTKFLRKLIDKYENRDDVIAAYNAGSPRRDKNGKYVNQAYVDTVIAYMNELK